MPVIVFVTWWDLLVPAEYKAVTPSLWDAQGCACLSFYSHSLQACLLGVRTHFPEVYVWGDHLELVPSSSKRSAGAEP